MGERPDLQDGYRDALAVVRAYLDPDDARRAVTKLTDGPPGADALQPRSSVLRGAVLASRSSYSETTRVAIVSQE